MTDHNSNEEQNMDDQTQNMNEEQEANTDSDSGTKVKAEQDLISIVAAKQEETRKAIADGKTELPAKGGDNEEGGETSKEQGEEISPDLIEAARSIGMTDEEIIDLATDNPKALETLAGVVNEADDSTASESEKDENDDKKNQTAEEKDDQIAKETDLSDLDPEVAKVVKPLLQKIQKLEESLQTVDQRSQEFEEQKAEEIQIAINKDFDNMNDEFPVLGDTKDMTTIQFKLRERVLDEALAINQLPSNQKSGVQWPDCLKQAALNLLGEPKKILKKKQPISTKKSEIKKLFTHRPSGRKSVSNKLKSEAEQNKELVEQIAQIQASIRQTE